MPYFLDGNNLIGRAQPTEDDRRALVAEVAGRLRNTRAAAVLFFDGSAGRESSLGPLRVRDGFNAGADEDILAAIGKSRSPREVTVVTADRALIRRARDAGARVLSPGEFWKRFGRMPVAKDEKDQPIDVEEWTRYFADERNKRR